MKSISKWSAAGFIFGGLFSLLSAIRYFVIWPDTDKAIGYVIMGLIIMAIAWSYNTQLKLRGTMEAMEEYIQDHPRQFPLPLIDNAELEDTKSEGGINNE